MAPSPFRSFLQAGFECGDILWPRGRWRGRRQDFLRLTGHIGSHMRQGYAAARRHGLVTVRDGFPWSTAALLGPSVVRQRLTMAAEMDMEPVWDLVHFGFPPGVDPLSDDFPDQVAGFAAEVAGAHEHGTLWLCPVNEITATAHFCGSIGAWGPALRRRGAAMKRNLVRATIAAIRAVRRLRPEARFLFCDPVGHVVSRTRGGRRRADRENGWQYEALDMLAGRTAPELGGSMEFLDVIGLNHYPHLQRTVGGEVLGPEDGQRRPLSRLIRDLADWFGRPVLVSETSFHTGGGVHHAHEAEGWTKATWLDHVAAEAEAGGAAGVCWYPIIDSPPWNGHGPRWSHGLIREDGSLDPELSEALLSRADRLAA